MTFDEYQSKALKTAIYPNIGANFIYPALGLVGEAGEVADKVKKVIRDKNGCLDEETIKELGKELGDVLWYIAALCSELNLSLNDMAKNNIDKLNSRKERDKIKGSGDNR